MIGTGQNIISIAHDSMQVVVLNTNLYNAPDNLTHNVDDPCGQLVWLEQQLQLAQIREKKVHSSHGVVDRT